MDNTTLNKDDLLAELSDEKARLFIPAILYVGVLMLIGTTGNIMVLCFYGCKTKPTPSTSFILALALFDLASCLVGMPMEIADLRYYFNFKSEPACKILRSVTHFTSVSSGLTLVIIAIDRHRRICKPFELQLNNKHVKFICLVTGFLAVILSVPAIFFNEVVDIDISVEDETDLVGKDCTTSKAEGLKPYILAFNAVYLIAFVLITTILSILYSLIGRQLCRHQKFRSYVARGGTKVKRITVRSNNNESSANLLSYRREASTLSNKVFADPPDATDSIVDMKEFVTSGLTQVETNRPSSGYTTVTGTTGLTGLTGLTGISGRSRVTMQSVKSVTICDPSQNQIIPIEARVTRLKKTISSSESTWSSIGGRRPGSADSFTSVSTRPISPYEEQGNQFIQGNMIQNENILYSNHAVQRDSGAIEGDEEAEDTETVNDIADDTGISGQVDEFKDETELPIIKHEMNEITDDNGNREAGRTPDETSTDDLSRSDSEVSEIRLADTENKTEPPHEVNNITDPSTMQQGKDTKEKDELTEVKDGADNNRPSSSGSVFSEKSKSSKGSRHSAVVSPMSCVTTSTVASRASTVKKMKRILNRNGKRGGKVIRYSDNMKELRLKMLDLNTVKYTMIMIIITILFVISFLPYLALVIWRYYQKEHEMNILTDTELVLFQIGIRSIFLNSSLNPMIYGGFNSKFRTFFYKILCSCCTFKKRKRKSGMQPRDQSDSTSGS